MYATWITYQHASDEGNKPENFTYQKFDTASWIMYTSSPGYASSRNKAVFLYEYGSAYADGGMAGYMRATRPALYHLRIIINGLLWHRNTEEVKNFLSGQYY